MATITNLAIAASTDDGSWSEAGYYSATATIIRLGDASTEDYGRKAWFRWAGTGMAHGALIGSASISVQARGVSGTIPQLRISAVDQDVPTAPTSNADATARPRTSASVTWTPTAWATGTRYTSPDISTVLQELADRPGFTGTLVILVEDVQTGNTTLTGQISLDTFESTTPAPAWLNVTYTPRTPPTASIGGGTTVAASGTLALTGTGTPTTAGATITGYTWRVISGGGSLSSTTVQNPTYTAPAAAATVSIGLIVTDSNGLQSTEATRTITVTGPVSTTATFQPAASGDDGSWHNEGVGSLSITGSPVRIGDASSSDFNRRIWLRFPNVTVQNAATIAAGTKLQVKAKGLSGTIPTITIVAQDADNPAAPTTRGQADAAVSAATTASVTWTPSAWVTDTVYDSPSIASVIQEIVDRPGWVSGNAILILLTVPVGDAFTAAQQLSMASFDGTPSSDAATLSITYTATVPTPNAGPDQGPVDSMVAINLTGAGSTGSPTAYQWRVISGGGTLSSTTIVNPTYKPPATRLGGTAVIGLKVGNPEIGTAEDTMTVTYRPHTEWHLNSAGVWQPLLTRAL